MIDIIFKLNPYMLTSNNYDLLSKINSNEPKEDILPSKKIKHEKNTRNVKEKKPDDELFWLFYTILNGQIIKDTMNTFEIEKTFKINAIEKLQSNPSILKPFRILKKKEAIHNLQDNNLNIYGLHALCLLYNKNIIYVNKYSYYEIHTSDESFHKIIPTNKLKLNISREEVKEIKNKYIEIVDFDKPLKSLSAYKKHDLISMATKMNIQTEGKNKTDLYNNINDLMKIEYII